MGESEKGTGEADALTRLKQRAQSLGWQCSAQMWSGYKFRYTFECAKGHRFEREARYVLYSAPKLMRCPTCRAGVMRTLVNPS